MARRRLCYCGAVMRPSTAGNEVDWSRRGAPQQLLTCGTKSYTWNNFGQLESMTDSDPNGDGDTSDSETSTYEYDLYGNLLSVGLPDGRTIEYDVDGAGRRVGRRENSTRWATRLHSAVGFIVTY